MTLFSNFCFPFIDNGQVPYSLALTKIRQVITIYIADHSKCCYIGFWDLKVHIASKHIKATCLQRSNWGKNVIIFQKYWNSTKYYVVAILFSRTRVFTAFSHFLGHQSHVPCSISPLTTTTIRRVITKCSTDHRKCCYPASWDWPLLPRLYISQSLKAKAFSVKQLMTAGFIGI